MTHRNPEDNALRGAAEPRTLAEACDLVTTPDLDVSADGMFGQYGGAHLPPQLAGPMAEVARAYAEARQDPEFYAEYRRLLRDAVGRPSPLTPLDRLSDELGGARIVLKREDLNHTGAHKINHTIGEALLAKRMGKRSLIAETGAGQHGVALATAAAMVGLDCEIHMGAIDVAKQHPNVVRMRLLGTKVVSVEREGRSLKEAVDSAFEVYAADPEKYLFAIGSVVGPHPFPTMIRDFQSVVGREARAQFQERFGALPSAVVAAVATKMYFSELSALEYFIVRHVAVLSMEPLLEGHFTLEELLSLIESRKPTIWNIFGRAFNKEGKKVGKKKGVFGVNLDILVEKEGTESSHGVGPGALRVPTLVDDAVSAMRQMDMSVEGVFRKNGNIRRLKDLSDLIDNKYEQVDLARESPVQIAALIKKFLREMPDPLLTFKLHRLFVISQSKFPLQCA